MLIRFVFNFQGGEYAIFGWSILLVALLLLLSEALVTDIRGPFVIC